MPAVALTDHGNIFGAVTFFKEAKARDIKPILGCEIYVAPRSRFDRKDEGGSPHHFHLLLLVKNEAGYRNLCLLLSKAYLEGFYYRPRIDKELLAASTEGLIGLSSCLKGEVAYFLERETEEAAEQALSSMPPFSGLGIFIWKSRTTAWPSRRSSTRGSSSWPESSTFPWSPQTMFIISGKRTRKATTSSCAFRPIKN
jgi:DNA polymerase-3 subunit alpha